MQINLDVLYSWGAVSKRYKKGDIIFEEDSMPKFYFQVIEGSVKLTNTNEEAKEFTQGIFKKGCSFGEPPLFVNEKYPTTAIANENSVIIKMSKEKFFNLLEEDVEMTKSFLNLFARRIYCKSETAKGIVNQKPAYRIISFLNSQKVNHKPNGENRIYIPFTRQEIANFTGLRVETVIRELIKMEKIGKVSIVNHKLYY